MPYPWELLTGLTLNSSPGDAKRHGIFSPPSETTYSPVGSDYTSGTSSSGYSSPPSPLSASPGQFCVPGTEERYKPYQLGDIKDLLAREQDEDSGSVGSILAYEMGLGKAIVSIGVIADSIKVDEPSTTLVVCPSVGMLVQWESECKKSRTPSRH